MTAPRIALSLPAVLTIVLGQTIQIFAVPGDLPVQSDSVRTANVTVQAGGPAKAISPDLFGIFFEDLSYAADGGLYAELVRNRSFEFSDEDHAGWNALTGWSLVERDGGKGSVTIKTDAPLNVNNPHYAVLGLQRNLGSAGICNSGFDGIPLQAGEKYDFSVFARQLAGPGGLLVVRLETKSGDLLGEAELPSPNSAWVQYKAVLEPANTDPDARLVLLSAGEGQVGADMISLFPQKTFHNRPNGLRSDLAQAIADLHPKFMRFPGGCLVHGDGLDNLYNWKNTIGPVEQRKGQRNIWNYRQSFGLGYFEYFQFCEEIGAKPLPVVAAGVCCQNSGYSVTQVWEQGQRGLAMSDMPAYIQNVLDLIEWANGSTNSTWGALRAAAGHPASFHLQYLGIGNEDKQTEVFRERFKMIYDTVKAKHPEITVVGTVGPSSSGSDFTEGWKFANQLNVAMVDEHYYENPEWFLGNLHRYDNYNRAGTKVYVGEYASRGNTLFNALAEAAYLTSLERNGDVVRLASYAPLLCKEQHVNWRPDLIYFDNTRVIRSVNYYVQQLFSQNQGDAYLPGEVSTSQPASRQTGFLLGTWDTQAHFKDVKVVSAGQPLVDEPLTASADNWSSTGGKWSVADGAYGESAAAEPAISILNTRIAQTNYTLTLKAKKTGGREGFLIGFGVRDSKNYYWWNIGGWGNTRSAVEKNSNGSKITIGSEVEGSIELNRWYDIKLTVMGGHLQCYLDDVLVHDLKDLQHDKAPGIVASCVKDAKTGELILKLVNVTGEKILTKVHLVGVGRLDPVARRTVLAGDPKTENTFANPRALLPVVTECQVAKSFTNELPAYSLTILRMRAK